MEITEVRIKLTEDGRKGLHAYCSIILDGCFAVRDLRIIARPDGLFVAMPGRKVTANCPRCGAKNHLRALYCNGCGGGRNQDHLAENENGSGKHYSVVAHPINSACREMIQQRVLQEYHRELKRAKLAGKVLHADQIDVKAVGQSATT